MGYRHDPTRAARVIDLYTKSHLTCQEIATLEGITRGGIAALLRRHGIDYSQGTQVQTACSHCQKAITVPRKRWRTNRLTFCSRRCYYGKRSNPFYIQNRQGQRQARKAVMAHGFPLIKGQVVHHHDGNTGNNRIQNLAVFASQRDHMRFHHYMDAAPIWDGRAQVE